MPQTSAETTSQTKPSTPLIAPGITVAGGLREGRKVTDAKFDQVYPQLVRNFSKIHWTPIEVTVRATELLEVDHRTKLLDVGSGCGKFCLVGSLASKGHFTGIEQRPHLVEEAKAAAKKLGTRRVKFLTGDMADLDWSVYNAFYLFNPFFENEMKSIRIDKTIPMGHSKFRRYIDVVKAKLDAAAVGTKVITYYGFGGRIPASYQKITKEAAGTDFLELWVKVTAN